MGYRAHSGFWAYFAGGAFEKTLDAIRGGVFTVSAALVPFLSDFEDIAYTSPDPAFAIHARLRAAHRERKHRVEPWV